MEQADSKEVDIICLGTGLQQCIISAHASDWTKSLFMFGKHLTYGGQHPTLSVAQMRRRYDPLVEHGLIPNDRVLHFQLLANKAMVRGSPSIGQETDAMITKHLVVHGSHPDGNFVVIDNKPVPLTEAFGQDTTFGFNYLERRRARQCAKHLAGIAPGDPAETAPVAALLAGLSDFSCWLLSRVCCGLGPDYMQATAQTMLRRIRILGNTQDSVLRGPRLLYPDFGINEYGRAASRVALTRGATVELEVHNERLELAGELPVVCTTRPPDDFSLDGNCSIEPEDGKQSCKHLVVGPEYLIGVQRPGFVPALELVLVDVLPFPRALFSVVLGYSSCPFVEEDRTRVAKGIILFNAASFPNLPTVDHVAGLSCQGPAPEFDLFGLVLGSGVRTCPANSQILTCSARIPRENDCPNLTDCKKNGPYFEPLIAQATLAPLLTALGVPVGPPPAGFLPAYHSYFWIERTYSVVEATGSASRWSDRVHPISSPTTDSYLWNEMDQVEAILRNMAPDFA